VNTAERDTWQIVEPIPSISSIHCFYCAYSVQSVKASLPQPFISTWSASRTPTQSLNHSRSCASSLVVRYVLCARARIHIPPPTYAPPRNSFPRLLPDVLFACSIALQLLSSHPCPKLSSRSHPSCILFWYTKRIESLSPFLLASSRLAQLVENTKGTYISTLRYCPACWGKVLLLLSINYTPNYHHTSLTAVMNEISGVEIGSLMHLSHYGPAKGEKTSSNQQCSPPIYTAPVFLSVPRKSAASQYLLTVCVAQPLKVLLTIHSP
jgi:hypothetical protein